MERPDERLAVGVARASRHVSIRNRTTPRDARRGGDAGARGGGERGRCRSLSSRTRNSLLTKSETTRHHAYVIAFVWRVLLVAARPWQGELRVLASTMISTSPFERGRVVLLQRSIAFCAIAQQRKTLRLRYLVCTATSIARRRLSRRWRRPSFRQHRPSHRPLLDSPSESMEPRARRGAQVSGAET